MFKIEAKNVFKLHNIKTCLSVGVNGALKRHYLGCNYVIHDVLRTAVNTDSFRRPFGVRIDGI